jgi:hypothetical protein
MFTDDSDKMLMLSKGATELHTLLQDVPQNSATQPG